MKRFSTSTTMPSSLSSSSSLTLSRWETWLERGWLQVLQGSEGVEVGVGASGLGGLAGGLGFFQPLHLHEASALQLERGEEGKADNAIIYVGNNLI